MKSAMNPLRSPWVVEYYPVRESEVEYKGTTTTTYASKYFVTEISNYATSTATTTKNIYTPDGELVAYVETVGATSTRQYVHNDHLGSVSVTSNSDGLVSSVRDYTPFGSDRINETYGTQSRYSYIGREKDSGGETYLINRYYSSDRGQFLSIDPVFYEIGITSDGKKAMLDPQLQNAYSYSSNNPITKKDPEGRFLQFAPFIQAALTIAEVTFTGTAGIKTFESAYTNFWLPAQYPTAFTDQQKAQAPFRFGAEAALNWGSKSIPSKFGSVGVDSILFGAEYLPSPQFGNGMNYRSPIQSYTSNYPGITQQLYGMLNYAANSSSVQTRQQAVQGYNSSTGASSNESKLWLAPNGAIITWTGGVVAPAPQQSSTKK